MNEITVNLGHDPYVLRYPDGKYAAIDASSGGYLYKVPDILKAQRFCASEAIRYQDMFKIDGLFICKIGRVVFTVISA